MRLFRVVALAAVLTVGGAACGSDQDPGVTPGGTQDGPTTTSHLLERCPAGGPNATTPSAGCLDDEGKVAH